jgi:hypothetical protein
MSAALRDKPGITRHAVSTQPQTHGPDNSTNGLFGDFIFFANGGSAARDRMFLVRTSNVLILSTNRFHSVLLQLTAYRASKPAYRVPPRLAACAYCAARWLAACFAAASALRGNRTRGWPPYLSLLHASSGITLAALLRIALAGKHTAMLPCCGGWQMSAAYTHQGTQSLNAGA